MAFDVVLGTLDVFVRKQDATFGGCPVLEYEIDITRHVPSLLPTHLCVARDPN
jgi:hypothetical protein